MPVATSIQHSEQRAAFYLIDMRCDPAIWGVPSLEAQL